MSTKSAVPSFRCSYRTAAGRQCRLLSTDPHSGLCPQHLKKQKDPGDLTKLLLPNWQSFQTAQGINSSLTNLYKLLAANRISPRRASVLAFISSLLLHTLPAIDADLAAGIIDPTAETETASEEREAFANVVAIEDARRDRIDEGEVAQEDFTTLPSEPTAPAADET